MPVHDDTRRVLHAAAQVSAWTDGKFDVTFGALADVWKFDHDQDNRVPTAAEIAARLPLVDYRAGRRRRRPGHRVHRPRRACACIWAASARATPWTAPWPSCARAGLRDFMVQAGGDLYVAGTRGDAPWRLGIQDPRGPGGELCLGGARRTPPSARRATTSASSSRTACAITTSSIRTPAQPARGCRSVTIVARDATVADGLSTGVFILGPERGMALVERLPDVEAVIVTADNEVLVSSGLRQRLAISRPPTP